MQHSLCDNLLAPYFENHLIYDNAACRREKGTLFAMNRLNHFMTEHYKKHGRHGWFLKCDVRKFFDNIDHEILKSRLQMVDDERTKRMLYEIIDSYEVTPGKGIPMGNQTSQWFALWYLDPLDRLVKEKMRIRHYTRYMDDMILLSDSKKELTEALRQMRALLADLKLEFNQKTQIIAMTSGVEYLGWRFGYSDTGAILRRLKPHSKTRWSHRLRRLKAEYAVDRIESGKILESVKSYYNHLSYGNTDRLYNSVMRHFVLVRRHD